MISRTAGGRVGGDVNQRRRPSPFSNTVTVAILAGFVGSGRILSVRG